MSVDAHTCSCCAAADANVAASGASRRTVLRASAGVLAGGVAVSSLAACGGSDDEGGATAGGATADSGATTPAGGGSTPAAGGGDALATLSEVPVGGALAVSDGAIILAQPTAGTVLAFDSKCPHQGCKVAVSGTELACPCHGSKFDVATGDVTNGPATTGLTKVDVTVDGDNIVAG